MNPTLFTATPRVLILLALLAATRARPLIAQEPAFRSSAERRAWLADERQLPRQRERVTHRGYEVSTGPIIVIAASADEARAAAEQATAAWSEAAALADRFTQVHRQPNFAQGGVQLVLQDLGAQTTEPPPAASVAPIGRVMQIVIGASADPSADHEQQLQQAVAQAFFRVAELDETLPTWVSRGLAAHLAGVRPEGEAKDDAAARVAFLLEGSDGRHAGPFLDLLRQELETARPDVDRQFQRRQGNEAAPPEGTEAVERFFAGLAGDYAAWQADLLADQPQIAADEDGDADLQHAREGLAFALKLADRFGAEATAGIRTRVTTFDKGRRHSVALTHQGGVRPPSLAALLSRITSAGQPAWATIGPDSKLLWSDDTETLRELLGVEERRYQYAWREDKWVLETTLADGRKLSGWLEPNPENERRPLARFATDASP